VHFRRAIRSLFSRRVRKRNLIASSEVAHIVGTNGPRSACPLPEHERDRYGNLILLCEEHHHLVDALEQDYPVEKLRQMKEDHEALMTDATGRAVAQRVENKVAQSNKTEVVAVEEFGGAVARIQSLQRSRS
jgi:hypothetical protein